MGEELADGIPAGALVRIRLRGLRVLFQKATERAARMRASRVPQRNPMPAMPKPPARLGLRRPGTGEEVPSPPPPRMGLWARLARDWAQPGRSLNAGSGNGGSFRGL